MAANFEAEYRHELTQEKKEKITKAIKEGLLYLAEIDSTPVGYLLTQLLDKDHPIFPNSIFIHDLFVKENFRNQGIGKKLVEFALSQKYPAEYNYFALTRSPGKPWLTEYYERFGFKVTGKTEVGNIKLTKSLR